MLYVRFGLTLLISLGMGSILGYINYAMGKDAGAKTFALVSLGATLVSMVSTYFFVNLNIWGAADPGRISASVVTALSFLGTGMIWFSEEKRVKGVSSVANLWITALLGLMLGCNIISKALIGFVFILVVYLAMTVALIYKKKHGFRRKWKWLPLMKTTHKENRKL
ncbi:MAG: MgtC/SapB family protein [Acidobacteriota bacterium]